MKLRLWTIVMLISLALSDLIIVNTLNSRNLLPIYIISLFVCGLYVVKKVPSFSPPYLFFLFFVMLFYVQPISTYAFNLDLLEYQPTTHRIFALLHINAMYLFCVGNSLVPEKVTVKSKMSSSNAFDQVRVRRLIFLMFMTMIVILSIALVQVGPSSLLRMSRIDLKLQRGFSKLALDLGSHMFSFLIFLVIISPRNVRKLSMFTWTLFFILVEILYFLFFRTRSNFVQHFMTVLVSYFYRDLFLVKNPDLHSAKGRNRRRKWLIILFMFFLLATAVTLRFFRGSLEPGQSFRNFTFDLRLFLTLSIQAGDLGYAGVVMRLIELFPKTYGFLNGQSYYRLLFVLIPRFIWATKPRNTQQLIGTIFRPNSPIHSQPPGVVGDMYINFGLFGWVIMLLFGLGFGYLGKKQTRFHIGLWAVGTTWIFHLVRGGFTNPLVIFGTQIVIFKLLYMYISDENLLEEDHQGTKTKA